MLESPKPKIYDLEARTLKYAKDVIVLINKVPNSISNNEIMKQVIRSTGSVGANYIEANGALGKKDFSMKIRICRKEAKESKYWLSLMTIDDENLNLKRLSLINETDELVKIFGSILKKTKS